MLTITKNWLLDRNPTKSSDKLVYKEPPLTDSHWSAAFNFAISKITIESINNSDYFNYDKDSR